MHIRITYIKVIYFKRKVMPICACLGKHANMYDFLKYEIKNFFIKNTDFSYFSWVLSRLLFVIRIKFSIRNCYYVISL